MVTTRELKQIFSSINPILLYPKFKWVTTSDVYAMMLSIRLSLSDAKTRTQNAIFSKTSNLELRFLLKTNRKSYMRFFKEPILGPLKFIWRMPSRKSLNRYISTKKIIRFWWNLVSLHDSRLGTRWQSCDQMILFKFKMADGRHIENRLMAINQQPIVRFQRNFPWGSSFYCATRMHSADYAVARCLSIIAVRLSHASILSKRLYISKFFRHRVSTLF